MRIGVSRDAKVKLYTIVIAVILVVAVIGVVGWYLSQPKGGPVTTSIKIGMALPLSGGLAGYGIRAKEAIDLYVEKVNGEGGLAGTTKIEIIYYDDLSDSATHVSQVEKLILEDNVVALIAGYGYACYGGFDVAEKYGVPIMAWGVIPDAVLAGGKNYTHMFCVAPSNEQWASNFYECFINVSPKPTSISYILLNIEAAVGLGTAAQSKFEAKGVQTASWDLVETTISDYTPILSKIKGLNPDIIFFVMHMPQTAPLIRQAKEMGITPKAWVGAWGVGLGEFILTFGQTADNICGVSPWEPLLPFTEARDFAASFFAKYGTLPDGMGHARPYAAIEALGKAIESLLLENKEVTRETVTEALKNLKAVTCMGETEFIWFRGSTGARGWCYQNKYAVCRVFQIKSGVREIVYPSSEATKSLVYPFPGWK